MTDVDRSIPFIETHHHLWELDRFHYDWLQDPGWAGHNALLGDYKMIRSTIGTATLSSWKNGEAAADSQRRTSTGAPSS